MPAEPRRLVEVALRYAEHGWPVLPLHTPRPRGCSRTAGDCGSPGKHPRTGRGLHDASTDPGQVRAWWTRWPHANVGVITGATSGLLVLDIDLPDGPASLARLQADHGILPKTCEQRTGSGGRQLLFSHPGGTVGNRARLVPGMDVRGDGGYIVVPPSIHATGVRYQWRDRIPPAEAPGWLLALLDRRRQPDVGVVAHASRTLPTGSPEQRYVAAAVRRELAALASAVEGSRNDTLNRAAFNLGQLAGAGLIDQDHVAAELEHVAARTGLGSPEIRRTIASGLAAGVKHPRTPPPAAAIRPTPDPESGAVPTWRIATRLRAAAHTISARFGHDITGHAAGNIAGWIRGNVDRFKQLHERVGRVVRHLVPPDNLDRVIDAARAQAVLEPPQPPRPAGRSR